MDDYLASIAARLSADHRRALEWFIDHEDEVGPKPKRDELGLTLVAERGIHKPDWLPSHAISIAATLSGSYEDGDFAEVGDGTWVFRYHQHGVPGIVDRKTEWMNRSLIRCLDDRIPVGVLEQTMKRPKSRYRVRGLAFVDAFTSEGFFILHGPVRYGEDVSIWGDTPSTPYLSSEQESYVAEDRSEYGRPDERHRRGAEVVARVGQRAFKKSLIKAYDGRCAVTQYAARPVLEGAHILPHLGGYSNTTSNGVLLRADIHKLFDRGMLVIEPETLRIELAPSIRSTDYADLEGHRLHLPERAEDQPDTEGLAMRYGMASIHDQVD